MPSVLFPFLPPPARIGALALIVVTIVADMLAWLGNLGGKGVASGLRPVPLFGAVALTGFTVASAALPRIVYDWLQRRHWAPGCTRSSDPVMDDAFTDVCSVFGSHLVLAGLTIAAMTNANGAPSRVALSGIAGVGVLLWVVHEALRARKIYELSHESAPEAS